MELKKGDKIKLGKLPDKYEKTVDEIIEVLEGKYDEITKLKCAEMLKATLEVWYEKNEDKSVEKTKKKLIPILEKIVEKSSEDFMGDFFNVYKSLYAFAGRKDLECFIDYMEFDKPNRVLAVRREVLKSLVNALNNLAFDPDLKYVIASFFPSAGKSFSANYYTAWTFGLSISNSTLRMSYSEELVLGFSRSIKDIISSPSFADVFPKYKLFNGKPLEKEKDSDWKIKNANVLTSHMARTRDGATTGIRANKTIIFDDMTKGADEASNSALHNSYYDKWKTEWSNRKDGKNTKYLFLGTMWSPEDILNRVREDREKISPLIPSKKYKYTWVSEDGSTIVIRVPLLDENKKSTCEDAYTTSEALEIEDTTDPYLFSCVYQQDPIAPSGLEFAWELLNQYETLPVNEKGEPAYDEYSFAVLDSARKGKDNVSMPIFKHGHDGKYYLIDTIFKKKAMTELYDDIIDKIIEHQIIKLVVESNIDTSLKSLLEQKLKDKGYLLCEIVEKYSTKVKEQRIKDMRGVVKSTIVFKAKNLINPNTDMGRFMENLVRYSFDYPNKHDDAPDSASMFASEIIIGKGAVPKPVPVDRREYGI